MEYDIVRLFDDITSKEDMVEKPWLIPAIISHIYTLSGENKETVRQTLIDNNRIKEDA